MSTRHERERQKALKLQHIPALDYPESTTKIVELACTLGKDNMDIGFQIIGAAYYQLWAFLEEEDGPLKPSTLDAHVKNQTNQIVKLMREDQKQ